MIALQPATIQRTGGRPRRAQRGQALIIAVVIMFLLAGLGGMFIALINQAMVQTAKAEDRAKLNQIAEAGLQQVKAELLYSADGADWRPEAGPDTNNPGWTQYGAGFYRAQIFYGPREEIDASHPMLDNPLDRYLKIVVEAKFALSNPPEMRDPGDTSTYEAYKQGFLNPRRFQTRRLVAFIPLGLPDYLLWITNLEGTPEPVVLGPAVESETISTVSKDPSTLADIDLSNTSNSATATVSYLALYDGPIRSDADTNIGNVRVDLTNDDDDYTNAFAVKRRDLVEIAGKLMSYDGASATCQRIMVNAHTRKMRELTAPFMTQNGSATAWAMIDPIAALESSAISTAMKALQYVQTRVNNPLVRPLRAPRLDERHPTTGLDRYRALTRDSGVWNSATAVTFNSGYIGWGEGCYVDNPAHLQYRGDLARLREEWLNPQIASSGSCWSDADNAVRPAPPYRRFYKPAAFGQAVEIILHDWEMTSSGSAWVTQMPFIEMRRYDGVPFHDAQGKKQLDQYRNGYYYTAQPYPRNGVLFAEGNLAVRGRLPASIAYDAASNSGIIDYAAAEVGGTYQDDEGKNCIKYYVSPANRRYDLTIVSGGTIYIEGNLLNPSSRRDQLGNRLIEPGSPKDSKLALLAMDNICLNPTRMTCGDSDERPTRDGDDYYWVLDSARRHMNFTISTAGPISPRLRVLLRHAGRLASAGVSNEQAAMSLLINNTPFIWNTGALPAPYRPQDLYFFNASNALASLLYPASWGGGLLGVDPLNDQTWAVPNGVLRGYGAENTFNFTWESGTTTYELHAGNELVGPGLVFTGLDMEVDAMMYAQRGSWFVIPGRFYNEDKNLPLKWPFPKYQEPLDLRIVVNGAIAQNRPAPPDAEEAWVRHWRGSNLSYFTDGTITDTSGAALPNVWDPGDTAWDVASSQWANRRMGIEYHYDATLMRPVCYDYDPVDNSRRYRPRLPKLPVSPSVFSFGVERGG